MNLFRQMGVESFCVQHAALEKLKRNRKQSAIKLYLWICSASERGEVTATAARIRLATGLDADTIQAARKELVRLELLHAAIERGHGRTHCYTVRNLKTGEPFQPAEHAGHGYFHCPRLFVRSQVFKNDSGAATFIYLTALANANRLNNPSLRYSKSKLAALAGLTPKTTAKALSPLAVGPFPFLKVKPGKVEILNPQTDTSLETYASQPTFTDSETGELKSANQLITPENIRKYFLNELPDLDPDTVQQDVCCPFHVDTNPSMSVNLDEGVWKCHVCDGAEGGVLAFELRLLDTEEKQIAWKSIGKKLGVRMRAPNPGPETHRHGYTDALGEAIYQVRRYEDGSARFYGRGPSGKWRSGLRGVLRVPYHLPQVRDAEVVIFSEGEKKADIITALGLCDANGKPVAVTCTGGATSWRIKFVEYFIKKRVLILRDSDEGGISYANAVAASLTHAGIEHRVIDFDDYGNDVRDFLKDQGAADLVEYIGSDWLAAREVQSEVPSLEGV